MTVQIAKAAARQRIEDVYRSESRRVFATLVRVLGDFDLAEEALHDAFTSAMEAMAARGRAGQPASVAGFGGPIQAIDAMRRRARHDASLAELAERLNADARDAADKLPDDAAIEDDRLRLIFTCCHPALPPEARVALTLREVCGLMTEEIARAFLAAAPTVAQRIVRAKAKIKAARIPYQVPARADLPDRLETVLQVIYLVFNEGYSASSGESLTRRDLSEEAIRLGRLLKELLPEPQVLGLLALMCCFRNRAARHGPHRRASWSCWRTKTVRSGTEGKSPKGLTLVQQTLATRQLDPYVLQAAIAAVHAEAPTAAATDWARIAALYDVLLRAEPSPVVELNRAVAIAMRDGPLAGLELIDALLAQGNLDDYHLAHAARAELCRRSGRTADARAAYERAIALARQETERRFLQGRAERPAAADRLVSEDFFRPLVDLPRRQATKGCQAYERVETTP